MPKQITISQFAGTWKLLKLENGGVDFSLPRYQKLERVNVTRGIYRLVVRTIDGREHIQLPTIYIPKYWKNCTLAWFTQLYLEGSIVLFDDWQPIQWQVQEQTNFLGQRDWLDYTEPLRLEAFIDLGKGVYRVVLITADGARHPQKQFKLYQFNRMNLEGYAQAYQQEGFNYNV